MPGRHAGDLPPSVSRAFLAHARKNKLPLTEAHLIWGAPYHEIADLLEELGRPMPTHLLAKGGRVAAE